LGIPFLPTEELEAEGMRVMLPVHHVDTDNPEKIDQIVNSVRRPWQDTEQRRKLVAQLREKGHSHQRIADAVGTHKSTVQADLKADALGAENSSPGADKSTASTGKDGKTRKQPATPVGSVTTPWCLISFDLRSPPRPFFTASCSSA
jgi:hypothetical protein